MRVEGAVDEDALFEQHRRHGAIEKKAVSGGQGVTKGEGHAGLQAMEVFSVTPLSGTSRHGELSTGLLTEFGLFDPKNDAGEGAPRQSAARYRFEYPSTVQSVQPRSDTKATNKNLRVPFVALFSSK